MILYKFLCRIGCHNLVFVTEHKQCLITNMVDTITIHRCNNCKMYRYKFIKRFDGFVYHKETGYQVDPPWGLKADEE